MVLVFLISPGCCHWSLLVPTKALVAARCSFQCAARCTLHPASRRAAMARDHGLLSLASMEQLVLPLCVSASGTTPVVSLSEV